VVIVTPHTLHYSQAKLALQHGIHVLVEKPMVTNTLDAYDLWQTVQATGCLLGITFQSPYTANFGYLAAERDRGALGRVDTITGYISQGWLTGCANSWRQDPTLSGGGYMYDTGAHLLNAMMWLMNDPVVEVACFFDKHNSPVDITGVAIMKFQNGAIGSVTFAGNTPMFESDLRIFTDKLTIHTNAYGSKLEIFGKDRTPVEVKVDAREPLRAPARYGVLLSALMDAMYESGQTGKIVKVKPVPPVVESIVGTS
jgi:predicted dehydrogenase